MLRAVARGRTGDVDSMRVRLLRDLKVVFGDRRKLPTKTILAKLRGLPEAGWASYYGHPLEDRDLARLLAHYGIKSRRVKVEVGGESKVLMGYRSTDLHDAWERYL